VCSGVSGSAERQEPVPEPVQQPRVRVQVQGLGLGLVPAQGPLVRPGLRVRRLVAVVLACLFTLLFFI
tara:strand:+ start:103 stop:306 length:204 start_codon:yes stop_codon:yes gene_type:complete